MLPFPTPVFAFYSNIRKEANLEKNADFIYKMEVNPRSESVKDRFFLQAYERIGQGHAIPP